MIGIIGAMKVELEALKARLQDVTVTRISGVDFYSGKLHGTDVVAAVSGAFLLTLSSVKLPLHLKSASTIWTRLASAIPKV